MKLRQLTEHTLPWLVGGVPNWTHDELASVPLLAEGTDYFKRWLLAEAPHTKFDPDSLPPGLEFLGGGYVDLGFENLGKAGASLNLAYSRTGVRVPGTNYKIVWRGSRTLAEVLPITAEDSNIPTLPENWAQAVLVVNDVRPVWIGKLLRQEQVGKVNPADYRDIGPAYVPVEG